MPPLPGPIVGSFLKKNVESGKRWDRLRVLRETPVAHATRKVTTFSPGGNFSTASKSSLELMLSMS